MTSIVIQSDSHLHVTAPENRRNIQWTCKQAKAWLMTPADQIMNRAYETKIMFSS